jgi:hypothetical protein
MLHVAARISAPTSCRAIAARVEREGDAKERRGSQRIVVIVKVLANFAEMRRSSPTGYSRDLPEI